MFALQCQHGNFFQKILFYVNLTSPDMPTAEFTIIEERLRNDFIFCR